LANGAQNQEFRLADWRVKPDLGVLEKDGNTVSLEPRVMAVLLMLASKPGEVFSRQELEAQIWQGTVVGYDALAKAINKLRDALGDDRKAPRYIQTISKKGYRLVAEVHAAGPPKETPIAAEPLVVTRGVAWPVRPWLAVGSTLVVLIILGLVLFYPADVKNEAPQQAQTVPAIDARPTIVVLPFRNIGSSDNDDYLADGLTSDLTTNLSKLSGLLVTASNATLVYKNINISPEMIKQVFNARYAISGEVNKYGPAIRINVHLTDVEKGTILWAERYDRQFTDLFQIQDEVTQGILERLSLTLTREEQQRIAKRYTNNLDAYETFLRARFLINARTSEDNRRARELFKKAIELDPAFARAYAGMAYSYAIGYIRQWPADTEQPLEKALELSRQAITLDKELPESYWVAAFVYFYEVNLDKGTELLNQALALNPNYADAYAMLATNAISQGEIERALDAMAKAYRLNPAGGYLYDMQLARAHYFTNNYELAFQALKSALDRNPTFIDLQMYMAATQIRRGNIDEAAWMILEAKQANPGFDPHAWATAYPYLDNKGFREKLLRDIDLAEAYSRK
jgi:TolB-like protein/DNA-binding winged helix-turn-helix (wHTH) protein/Tfp pilus assembly protein PilF